MEDRTIKMDSFTLQPFGQGQIQVKFQMSEEEGVANEIVSAVVILKGGDRSILALQSEAIDRAIAILQELKK